LNPLANVASTLRANRRSPNPVVRHAIGALSAAHRVVLFFASAEHRSVTMTKLHARDSLHQTTPVTWMDRYPGVFAACRVHLGDGADMRILSFGCSTGDEVVTLRRYFPLAVVVGAEINRRSLAACRRRGLDDRITFVRSEPDAIGRHGPYDAIFCMAVLQRTPHTVESQGVQSLERIYPFEKFDRQVSELDGWLREGGLLVVHHAQYRFTDSSIAHRYATLDVGGQDIDPGLKFDRNSRRVEHVPTGRSIFVKLRPGLVPRGGQPAP